MLKQAWEDKVRKVVPYVPGEQPSPSDGRSGKTGIIKLNTNENPYPPAPDVQKALQEITLDSLRLYPDPASAALVDALAERYGLKPEQVFVGVGSDDVLAMAFLAFFNSKKPILFPDITYSFYDVWAELFGIPYFCPPLKVDFTIRIEDYFQDNGGIILANPNAPTGLTISLDEIRLILEKNSDVIIILDEAYIDFGGDSAISLITEFSNLLVVQTFSKSRSLAGMRIGYAMGQPKLVKYLNDVKYSINSYTMSRAALCLGVAAVKDEAYFRETLEKIIHTRERCKQELSDLGFQFGDSRANFIFATHPGVLALELFQALKAEKIIVRHFNQPRVHDYLRITIGTDSEMDALLSFLRQQLPSLEGRPKDGVLKEH